MDSWIVLLCTTIWVCISYRFIAGLFRTNILTPVRIIIGVSWCALLLVVAFTLRARTATDSGIALFLTLASLIGIFIGIFWTSYSGTISELPYLKRIKLALRVERRFAWIAGSAILVVAATYCFGKLATAEKLAPTANSFWGPFYQAWTAGLTLWMIVGIIGTVVALAKPEDETYSERIRILFGGRNRPVLHFLAQEIRSLGYFATWVSRDWIIEEWDDVRGAYKIRVVTKTKIVNLLHDEKASAEAGFSITPDPFNPPLMSVGEVTAIRINGINQITGPLPVTLPKFDHPLLISIDPGDQTELEVSRWAWVSMTEPHSYAPRRFTEEIRTTITYEANTPEKVPELRYSVSVGGTNPDLSANSKSAIKLTMTWGNPIPLPAVKSIEPQKVAYEFTLSAPI